MVELVCGSYKFPYWWSRLDQCALGSVCCAGSPRYRLSGKSCWLSRDFEASKLGQKCVETESKMKIGWSCSSRRVLSDVVVLSSGVRLVVALLLHKRGRSSIRTCPIARLSGDPCSVPSAILNSPMTLLMSIWKDLGAGNLLTQPRRSLFSIRSLIILVSMELKAEYMSLPWTT